jgi:hypothetical protein
MLENKGKDLKTQEEVEMAEEDIINKLMEPTDVPEKTYKIERLGITVTLKGLSEREIQRIRKECTTERKHRGQRIKELNEEEFNAALIEKATVKPNWSDKRLLDKLSLSSGREVIKRKLLAGEMVALGDKVMELSGFDDDLEEVKN